VLGIIIGMFFESSSVAKPFLFISDLNALAKSCWLRFVYMMPYAKA